MPTTHSGRAAHVTRRGFGPVTIVVPALPPVGEFTCDTPGCIYSHGTGERALFWHARRYGHTTFTPGAHR